MPSQQISSSNEVQYLQVIDKLAKSKINQLHSDDLLFDTQGNLLLDISRFEIEAELKKIPGDIKRFSQYLTNETTTVCIDGSFSDEITGWFYKKLKVDKSFKALPKGSINPIYREMYFNLNCVKRVYLQLYEEKIQVEKRFSDDGKKTIP